MYLYLQLTLSVNIYTDILHIISGKCDVRDSKLKVITCLLTFKKPPDMAQEAHVPQEASEDTIKTENTLYIKSS